jgi:hypothetical protein
MKSSLVSRRLRPLILLVTILLLAACSFSPLDVIRRDTSAQSPNPDLALTVTAVYATNTQIAIWRTGTAVALPAVATAAAFATQPPLMTTLPPVPPDQGDVTLIYSPEALTLLNTSGRALSIAGLSFQGEGSVVPISLWDNGFLSASLFAFPSGDCLMAWPLNTNGQPKPNNCGVRHAWIAVNGNQTFWLAPASFTVYWGGQPIASCPANAGTCVLDLPE